MLAVPEQWEWAQVSCCCPHCPEVVWVHDSGDEGYCKLCTHHECWDDDEGLQMCVGDRVDCGLTR